MRGRTVKRFLNLILVLLIFTTLLPFKVYAAETFGMLLNGSFEDGINFAGSYYQPNQSQVPNWSTTATDKKIELYKANSNFYITGVSMAPTDGIIGAELNAEEESTLYQVVQTEPFSLYEWGLDHAARTSANTMALIIGPNQVNAPSKNYGEGYDKGDLSMENPPLKTGYKYGRDQLMQMVDWLKAIGKIGDVINTPGIANNGQAIIIYSKKFGENGSFLDDADSRPFSLTPSSVYSERWYIWIMTDNCATSGENPWGHYGLNDDENTDKYYLYKVPEGQTSTLFSFVSVETTPKTGTSFPDPTYGNFLDNINFKIYRKLSASSSTHGSGIVGTSNGNVGGEQSLAEYEVTVDNELVTYVSDGDTLNVQAKIGAAEKNTASFAGFFYTYLDNEGNSQTEFLKKDSVTEVVESDGSLTYSYALNNITSAVNIHFVFIKSPLITYDSNGGKPYKVTETGSNVAGEDDNVYNFIPDYDGELKNFVVPYFSHAAEGLNDGWKFINWSVYSEGGYVADIPAEHEISCNYEYDAAAGATGSTQNFKIYENVNTFTSNETSKNVTWIPEGEGYVLLKDINAKGLTMVANWEWKHMFIPVTEDGGTVSLISTGETEDTGNGSFAYYSSGNETIRVKATPNENYVFLGWYDENDNLITLDEEFEYTSAAQETPVYYAKFEKRLIQQYKRKLDGVILPNDDASRIPLLDHSRIECAEGEYVSSTASNNETYALEGWYDEAGNKVDDSLLSNNGKTISYIATENKTYIAKYVRAISVNFKRQYLRPDGTYFETATNGYGTLSIYSASGAPGGTVSSKAYPGTGYYLYGWYDADNNKLSEDAIFSPVLTDTDGVTYYARFASRSDTKYTVNHIFKNFNGTSDKKVAESFVGVTGVAVTPIQKTNLDGDYEGYVYVSGIETKTIDGSGKTVFNLHYSKEENELVYNKNNENATGETASTSGYTGLNVPVNNNGFTLEGYKFNGWNTSADGTGTSYAPGYNYLLIELDEEGNNPNVLYAMWVPQETLPYKVQHYKTDKNGDVVGNPEEDAYFALEGSDVNAVAKNYNGYLLDLTHAGTISSGTIPPSGEGELVLKLYYKPAEDTLTYKPNGGVENDVVVNGHIDEKLTVKGAIFTRPGYTFTGWKDANGVSYSENSKYTLSTQTDILYAQWSANTDTPYIVEHYLLNADASNANLHQRENKTGTTGKTVSASALTVTGYTVKTDLNSGAFVSKPTGVITGDGSLVLKLYYVPNDITLTYNANGGVGSDKTFVQKYGTTASIIDNPFTKEGYSFAGWSEYRVGDTYTFNENKTLYATWTPNTNTKYTIEYYLLNSDETNSTLYDFVEKAGITDTTAQIEASDIIDINGYTYNVGYSKEKLSGNIAGDGSLVLKLYYNPNSDILRYKKFDTDDSLIFDQAGHVNETLDVLNDLFTRDGYTFAGWMLPDGTDYDKTTYKLTAGDDVLIAKWDANTDTAYKIEHYILNNEYSDALLYKTENKTATTGTVVNANSILIEGYNFFSSYSENVVSATVNGDGSTTLKLYYQPNSDTTYKIEHYLLNPDNTIKSLYNVDSKSGVTGAPVSVNESSALTITGYTYNPDAYPDDRHGLIKADGSLVLKMYYSPKQFTLTYKANGGVGDDVAVTKYYGETDAIKDNMFTRPGYEFVGWSEYSVGQSYTFEEDKILYARWQPSANTQYKIEYYLLNSDKTASLIYGSPTIKYGTTGEIARISQGEIIDIIGYTYEPQYIEEVLEATINGDGSTVLRLYYAPNADKLIYKKFDTEDSESFIQDGHTNESLNVLDNMFTYEDHTFIGWMVPGGTDYNDSTYILTPYDDVLIAKWRNDATTKYTVEHIKEDLNGFVLLEEETLYGVAGKPITATPKNFPGTTYMPDYELELKSAAINADGSTVLRLYYSTDMVKLIYHSNYGEDSQIERTAAYGTNKTIEDNMFTRPGYEFKGWSTTPDGNGDNVAVNSSLTLTEEKHLYAMWEAKTITITYNANGGTGADVTQSGIAGETKTTIENPFTMLQSVFVGWNTKADGSGTMYDENADFIMPDEDTTLYAIWRLAPLRSSYTVIHYLLKSDNTVNKIYNEEVKGGNVEENVSETFKEIPHYTSKPEMSTTSGKVDLEGLLKLELYYFPDAAKIIYHDGEEYINELNVYYDEDHTIITSPVVRDNKVFKGWKDEDGVIYNVNDIYTVNKDILNLFAIWEDTSIPPVVDKLTYKANINFDTDADVEQSGNQNDSITVKGQLFTRNGYEFKGWNTKHDGTGTWYYENDAYTLSDEEDILFAIWEEIPVYEYKIYHKTSSGIILKEETKQAQKGETVSANSLDFNGYTYADGYDGSIKQGTVLDENLELVLFYTPNSNTQYKVEHYLMNVEGTYDLDPDEVESLNGSTGTNVGATKNTYDGYIFDETGENILQGEIQANGSLVLKVYYRRLSSKIVFDSNTGENKEFTGLIGQNTEVINNPFVKDGYEFIEWNTKADGNGEKIEIGQSVSYEKETKTYYAIWKKKTEETPEEEKPVIPERKPVINTGVGMKEVLLSWIYGIMRFFESH